MESIKDKIANNKTNKPLRFIGAYDGLTAKLIEEAGFEGIWSSGLCISASYGLPDASVLSWSQFLERSQEMRRVSSLPILADIDTGFGSPETIGYIIREYIDAGIDGVCIEDKVFPKRNSYFGGEQSMLSAEEFCMKLDAVKSEDKNNELFLVARIESFISGTGLEDALYRADSYYDSGADAILIHSKSWDGKDIESFLKSWEKKCPIVIVPTSYPEAFPEEIMKGIGIDIVIYANQLLRVFVEEGNWLLAYLSEEGLLNEGLSLLIDDNIASVKEVFDLIGMDKIKEKEKRYKLF